MKEPCLHYCDKKRPDRRQRRGRTPSGSRRHCALSCYVNSTGGSGCISVISPHRFGFGSIRVPIGRRPTGHSSAYTVSSRSALTQVHLLNGLPMNQLCAEDWEIWNSAHPHYYGPTYGDYAIIRLSFLLAKAALNVETYCFRNIANRRMTRGCLERALLDSAAALRSSGFQGIPQGAKLNESRASQDLPNILLVCDP